MMQELYTQDDHVITVSDEQEDGTRSITCDCGQYEDRASWAGLAINLATLHVLAHDMTEYEDDKE